MLGFIRHIHTFDSLRSRDYRLLWASQVTTAMGMWMDQLARGWLVYELTHSPVQLGLIAAVRGVPMLLFSVVAGWVADRYGVKPQIILAQATNTVLNLLLAILILTGRVELWHIYVTGFLAGTVQALQMPARQVIINDLVEPKHLLNAIALNSAAMNVSRSIGPFLAGVLIVWGGVGLSYLTEAVFYGLAILWTARIRIPQSAIDSLKASKAATQSFAASLKEGFQYLGAHRVLMGLMALGMIPALIGMPFMTLMPVFAIDVFQRGPDLQAQLTMMVGIGGLTGALVAASLRAQGGSGRLLIGFATAFGVSLVLFSQSPVIVMALVFALTTGFFQTSYMSQNQTAVQTIIPRKVRGRVLGIYMLNQGLMPVGSLLAGVMANAFGGRGAVSIMGTGSVVLAVTVALAVPALWKLDGLRRAAESASLPVPKG